MTRTRTARAAACLAAVLSTLLAGGLLVLAPSARAAAPEAAPLSVTIDSMTPSAIPRRGDVTLTGEITNTSDQTWTDLQAYLFMSQTPMTTATELKDAAATDPAAAVGNRVFTAGLYQDVGDLAPGQSAPYTLTVPRKDLGITGAPGVYWVGVHVLGAVDGMRDGVADGRARSFIPLMDPGGPRTDVALVIPLRDRVRRASDGHLLGLKRWQTSLGPDGRLDRLLHFGAESRRPITWLVDPGVLDAAASVARDNPPFSTAPDGSTPEDGSEPSGSPSPSPSPSDQPSGTGDVTPGEVSQNQPSEPAQEAAQWLAGFREQSARSTVLDVPYGDLDVAAVTGNRLGRILRKAEGLSERTMASYDITSSTAVAPPSGYLTPRALAALDPQTPVLMSDRAFPGVAGPLLSRPDGTKVVLLDSAAESGGPGPDNPDSALALRQRILAEAAVHALSPDRQRPLVVSTPDYWKPDATWQTADFFGGLDVPWLNQIDLNAVLARDDAQATTQPPLFPAGQRHRQVPFANQLATQELVDTGKVFAQLLTRNDTISDELAKAAMLASSYTARSKPGAALDRARNTSIRIRRTMQLVSIDGPPFVMMSSGTGPIAVTVVNNLDETVTVQLEAVSTTGDLKITTPDPITLGPGERSPVRMRADSTAIGVRPVTVYATTVDGKRLGTEVQFNVRSSNVGLVIWLVMGTGGALLLVMIVFRIVRRVRA